MKEIEIVQHFRVRGLRVFLNTVEYRTPHLHKELELIWILDGGMEIRGAKGMHVARTGDLAILNPKQMHALCRLDKPCSFLCIQVSPKFFAYSFPAISGLRFDELLLSRSMEDIAPLLDALALIYFRQEDGFELACAGQMHMLLYRLLQSVPHHILNENETLEQERKGERLNRLMDFVERNHQSKISLSDFAAEEKRSMSYLSHFVKENLGQSFQEYVNTVRFQTACSLIDAGRERLLDVCTEAGFSDYRYFSQTFRQRAGMSPKEYRQKRLCDGPGSALADTSSRAGATDSLERIYSSEESVSLFKQLRNIP